jgi:hypothetical protein
MVGLLGQDDLSAEALVLSTQSTEVDAAGHATTSCVLSVPDETVVAGFLLAARQRVHELARDVETDRVVSDQSGSKHQRNRINRLDELQTRNWGSVPLSQHGHGQKYSNLSSSRNHFLPPLGYRFPSQNRT